MTSVTNEKLFSIIATELQVDVKRVVPDALLREDLGMDSIAALNILYAAQEAFELGPIDEAEISNVSTVADVETLVRRQLEEAHA
jgi:acyl carrier protein